MLLKMNQMTPTTHWYQSIAVIPQSTQSVAYRRLARIFRDRTRVGKQSGHELVRRGHETRVTVNVFEHFALLPASWVMHIAEAAGIDGILDVTAIQWSYEFETIRDERWPKMIRDVTIHYRASDHDGIIVIETKVRPGALDLAKDISGYTGHQVFDSIQGPKHLLHVLDDASYALYAADLRAGGSFVLRWSDIIGIQLEMFGALGLPASTLREFMDTYRALMAWLPIGGVVAKVDQTSSVIVAGPDTVEAIENYNAWTRLLVNPEIDADTLANAGPAYLADEISFTERMALHISDARVNYTEAIWQLL
jgi:hypothetical protein